MTMAQPTELTILPVDQDVDFEERQFSLSSDGKLTIGGLKAEISNKYTLKKETNIVIQGLKEDIPDNALVSQFIPGTKIRFTASGDDQVNEDLASKGLRTSQKHTLTIDENEATDNAKQFQVIQNPEKSQGSVTANIRKNLASKDSNQQSAILSGNANFILGFH
ncbi:hypothetical protein F4806DRAFT_484270 [Annulohypoxylon nitens]|nr:hypothetical protein F4806DRAFT_484270 [Annulohypoxylon nitens]